MSQGGILNALYGFHSRDIPRGFLAMTSLLVVLNRLSSFQIYSMPVFDSIEASYTSHMEPSELDLGPFWFLSFLWVRKLLYTCGPGGIAWWTNSSGSFAYPCFMWVQMKKPTENCFNWYFDWIFRWGITLAWLS